jgi:hypothetical protein
MLTESYVGPFRYRIAPLLYSATIGHGPSHSAKNLRLFGFALIYMRSFVVHVCASRFEFSFQIFLQIISFLLSNVFSIRHMFSVQGCIAPKTQVVLVLLVAQHGTLLAL